MNFSIVLQLLIIIAYFSLSLFDLKLSKIRSWNMLPNLSPGESVLIQKFVKDYSIERGDIVIFTNHPTIQGAETQFISRVVGLPNDRINIKDIEILDYFYSTISINDDIIYSELIEDHYTIDLADLIPFNYEFLLFQEKYGNKYIDTIYSKNYYPDRNQKFLNYTLKEDQYFIIGDNRTDSLDSRYFGPINKFDIIGKVLFSFEL